MSWSRGVRFVFGLLLAATIASVAAMTLMYVVVGRSPTIASASTLVLRPAGDIPEIVPDVVLPIREGQSLTVRGYVDVIRKANGLG